MTLPTDGFALILLDCFAYGQIPETNVCLHRYGWYRVDPRGNKAGVVTDFCPPVEKLAFVPRLAGEGDIPERFSDALPNVVSALRRFRTTDDLSLNLPDYADAAREFGRAKLPLCRDVATSGETDAASR